jgi:hypothetical protein
MFKIIKQALAGRSAKATYKVMSVQSILTNYKIVEASPALKAKAAIISITICTSKPKCIGVALNHK